MTWKSVRVSDLDAETQRKAEENMEFWMNGMGLRPKDQPKQTKQPVDRTPRDVSWFARGEECPH